MTLVYSLLLTYGTVWQAVDQPTRAAESERTLVAAAALALFDRLLRTVAMDTPLVVSTLLSEDGGYYLSTAVTQSNREFETVAANLELTRPEHAWARAQVLGYLTATQKTNRWAP